MINSNTEQGITESHPTILRGKTAGEFGVGRRQLLLRISGQTYNDKITKLPFTSTAKEVEFDNKKYNVIISARPEEFEWRENFIPASDRQADFALLCFDLTDIRSFSALKQQLQEILRYWRENVKIVLVGTKLDLINKRVVSSDQVHQFLKDLNKEIPYIEVSSYTGENIPALMNLIIQTTCGVKPTLQSVAKLTPNALFQPSELDSMRTKCITFLSTNQLNNDFSVLQAKNLNGQFQVEIQPNNGQTLEDFKKVFNQDSKRSDLIKHLGLDKSTPIEMHESKRPWSSNFYLIIGEPPTLDSKETCSIQ